MTCLSDVTYYTPQSKGLQQFCFYLTFSILCHLDLFFFFNRKEKLCPSGLIARTHLWHVGGGGGIKTASNMYMQKYQLSSKRWITKKIMVNPICSSNYAICPFFKVDTTFTNACIPMWNEFKNTFCQYIFLNSLSEFYTKCKTCAKIWTQPHC